MEQYAKWKGTVRQMKGDSMPNERGQYAKWKGTAHQIKQDGTLNEMHDSTPNVTGQYVLEEKVNEKWYVLKDSNAPFPCRT